jgi:hypothetical protein
MGVPFLRKIKERLDFGVCQLDDVGLAVVSTHPQPESVRSKSTGEPAAILDGALEKVEGARQLAELAVRIHPEKAMEVDPLLVWLVEDIVHDG